MSDRAGQSWFVAIGASGGDGLDDIKAILRELPPALNAVVLIVLHRRWDKPSHLAAVLGRATHMPVRVALDGDQLTPGTAYTFSVAALNAKGTGAAATSSPTAADAAPAAQEEQQS